MTVLSPQTTNPRWRDPRIPTGWPQMDGPITGFPPIQNGDQPDRPWNDHRAESWPPIGTGGGVQPVPMPLPGPGRGQPIPVPLPNPGPGGGMQPVPMPLPGPGTQTPPTETMPVPAPAPEEEGGGGKLAKGKEFLMDWLRENPEVWGSVIGGAAGTYLGKKTKIPGLGWLGGLGGGFIGNRVGKHYGDKWEKQGQMAANPVALPASNFAQFRG